MSVVVEGNDLLSVMGSLLRAPPLRPLLRGLWDVVAPDGAELPLVSYGMLGTQGRRGYVVATDDGHHVGFVDRVGAFVDVWDSSPRARVGLTPLMAALDLVMPTLSVHIVGGNSFQFDRTEVIPLATRNSVGYRSTYVVTMKEV